MAVYRSFSLAGMIGLVLLTALAGCAGAPTNGALNEYRANRLVTAVLEHVEEIYFRETKPAQLVKAGFDHIVETHPEIEFAREGAFFVASVNEDVVFQFKEGPAKGAEDHWGESVAAALAEIEKARSGKANADLSELSDTFLTGVIDSLDGVSRYVSPEKARQLRARRQDNIGTLNIDVEHSNGDRFQVAHVYSIDLLESGTLQHGDIILSVDGTVIQSLTIAEVLQLFRGEIGSTVELSVLRAGAAHPRLLTVQREKSGANSVAGFMEGSILRIVMTHFNEPGQKVLRGLVLKESRDPGTMGVVLDLRGNPGGVLSAVVDSADDFLASGPIATTHGRHKDSHQSFKALPSPVGKRPMIVLVDKRSAAGAEILAATLQENATALVVGSATHGSGTIQTVMPLPNTRELLLTWAEVHTAGGYRLEKRGLMPTVCTGGSATVETILEELRDGRGVIDYATRTRDIDPDDAAAVEAFRALCPPRNGGTDISLEVARAILEDPALYNDLLARSDRTTVTAN